ncbi:YdcF family protein [Curtobacterium flaccumfaciens pv. flaccumfaciens]|nr:YdcF family protein [Curtobacterium flaccumfaciens pv. flaccumfaciens]MBO9055379.1 YdcF family protein [Curtobacterium flaccumfaciens pv. flaccumfaciens]QTR91074.1 YdcF family protein [Curtobacterium flaccumfaciens pv. flaccumfaciens]
MTVLGLGAAPVFALLFLVLYVLGRRRDPRMLRNGVFLTAAVLFGLGTVVAVLTRVVPGFSLLVAVVLLLVPLAVVVLGVALVANGLQMLRAEGRSVGNLLSLAAGVAVFVLPAVAIALLVSGSGEGFTLWDGTKIAVAVLMVFVCGYFALSLVAFALYSVVYGRTRHGIVPDTIVVLGSGLVHGEVPPLLQSRLDRALGVYRAERSAGRRPLLVPSGGQGDDEPRPEGTAMAEYLVANGADPDDVVPETASRNTRENLRFSRDVQTAAGRDGQMVVVTNNYHVLRAATLARRLDLPAQVVGARTAAYYVPSAFLREFAAVIVEHRWLNVIACTPFVLFTGFLLWESFQQ